MKIIRNQILRSALFAAAVCVAAVTAGCAEKHPDWLTDYEQAQDRAQKQHKNMFLFFSGEDWDGISTQLRSSVFDTPEFIKAAQADYVLVHLDFSESLYNSAETAEDATEAEKKAAAQAAETLQKNADAASAYSVQGMPTVLLVTPEGYVFGSIPYDETVSTAAQYIQLLNAYTETREKTATLLKQIKNKKSLDKVTAIDQLYELLEPSYRYLLIDLIKEVPESDPQNESGLVGKYQIQIAYSNAMDAFATGDVQGAVQGFVDAISGGYLSAEQTQEAYYTAAYLLAVTQSGDNAQVLAYLNNAYDAAPESEIADSIKMTIEAVSAQGEQE